MSCMPVLASDPERLKRWHSIKHWLEALDLIPSSPSDFEEDALEILGHIEDLKTGEILCRLANRIKPGSVDSILSVTALNELAGITNLQKFIAACYKFQITPEIIFTPNDLINEENLDAVLNTLEALFNVASLLGMGRQFTKHSLRRKSSKKMSKPTLPNEWRKFGNSSDSSDTTNSIISENVQEHIVTALYSFKGNEEDELSFEPGDQITVRNALDGKWWEGECNGKVGWFPGNFVSEVLCSPGKKSDQQQEQQQTNKDSSLEIFYNLDIQDLLDAKRNFCQDLEHLSSRYIEPMIDANILTPEQNNSISMNFTEMYLFENKLFSKLQEICSRPPDQQTVGECLLNSFHQRENLYFQFAACHPKAVSIITENSEKISAFIESQGGQSPGMLTLSMYLGKPMKMMERYVTQLMELERHMPEVHSDLPLMKQAAVKYKTLLTNIQELRKKKEVELEMVTSKIANWGGKNLGELGDCYFSAQVYLNLDFQRLMYALVFNGAIVLLEVQDSMSGYSLKETYELDRVTVTSVKDNSFFPIEIRYNSHNKPGTLGDTIYCDYLSDRDGILGAVEISSKRSMNKHTAPHQTHSSTSSSSTNNIIPVRMPLSRSRSDIPPTNYSVHPSATNPLYPSSQFSSRMHKLSQPGAEAPTIKRPLHWGFKSMRPLPPSKPIRQDADNNKTTFNKKYGTGSRKRKSNRPSSESPNIQPEKQVKCEDEAAILKIIEAYNPSSRRRHTLVPRPMALLRNNSLDTPFPLLDMDPPIDYDKQMKDLIKEVKDLKIRFENESIARKKLEVELSALKQQQSDS